MSRQNYGPPGYLPSGNQFQQYPSNQQYPPNQQYQQYQGNGSSGYPPQQFQRPNGPPPQQQYQRPNGPPPQQYPPPQQQDWEASRTDFRPSNNSQTQNNSQMQNNSHGMPPTGMQTYGNGQGYQYSNNQGKRKALLIGINYFNSSNQLGGCINDATAMANYLEKNRGYKRDDMVILTDDQSNPRSWPTKQNIIQAMNWLVRDARPNDCLFFHYSGHGGVTKDLDGDEEDGFDEVIYPVDFKQAGHIVDDDMHAIMVKPLPAGCRLTALFDSCHSGTALDLPFVYSTKGCIKEPNMYKDAGKGLLSAVQSYDKGDLSGAFTSVKGAFNRLTSGDKNIERVRQAKFSPADVISFSGCKDSQTSADSQQGSTKAGAMSYAFLEVMSQNPNQTYYTLLNNVRNVMAGRFGQKPQLSCSHPLDMNLLFIL